MKNRLKLLKSERELSLGEKTQMKEGLFEFMEQHRAGTSGFRFFKPWIATLTVFLLVGGTAFASQFSLPGDSLYGLKLFVNQDLKLWLHDDENEEVYYEFSAEVLRDADKLSEKGELNERSKKSVNKRINKNIEKLKKRERFEEERMRKILEDHAKVYEKLQIDIEPRKVVEPMREVEEIIKVPEKVKVPVRVVKPVEEIIPMEEVEEVIEEPIKIVEPVEKIVPEEVPVEGMEPIKIVEPADEIVEKVEELVEDPVEEIIEIPETIELPLVDPQKIIEPLGGLSL